jgi:hypothetical protein
MNSTPGVAVAIREITLHERPIPFRLPFRFGVITLEHCPQAYVRVRVAGPDGREAWGAAAEMLVPKWFDKRPQHDHAYNLDQLRGALHRARAAYLSDGTPATPFGHFERHYAALVQAARGRDDDALVAGYGPALIDRAVLDALGRLTGEPFVALLRGNAPGLRDSALLPDLAGHDWDAFLAALAARAGGTQAIDARHTVGLLDPLDDADLAAAPVGHWPDDGLPVTLAQVARRYGHHWYKLKVGGALADDCARLERIVAVLQAAGRDWRATLDGNEQYASVEAVQALLGEIATRDALAPLRARLAFVEQPLARDRALQASVAAIDAPVIIDESDAALDAFVQARALGYRGVSSKSCKGLYKSLANRARCARWNAQAGHARYLLSAEDLTMQAGLGVQQDLALVAALGIAHVERNGHHYVDGMSCAPADEQAAFADAHPDLYRLEAGTARLRIADGRIALGTVLRAPGLGSAALPRFDTMAALANQGAADPQESP